MMPHALPLKGQAGRALQDQGLAVTLRVSEDLESFEATTDIDITSPLRAYQLPCGLDLNLGCGCRLAA
ncbi:MAG TPA: hypothetical protein VH089_06030 [Streptosporangiaceae bacterium]|nr:hypothetical protein [Streptosporangiaceae bacterium]